MGGISPWTHLPPMKLFAELKRRNVIRVAIAYGAAAWLLIQVVETLFPVYGLPDDAIRLVVAVLAVGFVPALVIAWLFELTPEGIKFDAAVAADAPSRIRAHRLLDRVIMVALGLAVSYFAFDKLLLDPAEDARIAERARSEALIESYAEKSIAVLPFVNMSPDPDQAFFADGISEELLNLLARIPELRVISRSSAFSFRGDDINVRDVAEKLDVSHVLEGSVRKSGDRIRVTAQLIEARTDTHLWSQTYERELGDIFGIQDEIAKIVVEELESRLVDRLRPSRRTDPEVYALFLKGRNLTHAARADSDDIERAEMMLRRAIEIDPGYAPAWSSLALTIFFQTSPIEILSGRGKYPRSEGEQLFREAFQRALDADPLDGVANAYLGWELFFDENDPGGVRFVEKALSSEPNNVEVVRTSGAFARAIGHWDAAEALGQRAIDLDPMCQICYGNLAAAYFYGGKLSEAEAVARRRVAIFNRGKHVVGQILLARGEAQAALLNFDELEGWERAHGRALALQSLGREAESRAAFADFLELTDGQSTLLNAMAYAWLGDSDDAFESLDSSWHPNEKYFRFDFFVRVAWQPMFRNLHDESRWQAYWETAQTSPEELQRIKFRFNQSAQ